MKKAFGMTMAAAAFASGTTSAGVLYSNPDGATAQNVVQQEFGDYPTYSCYVVDDVTFGTGVNIDGITTWMTLTPAWIGTVTQARLNIFSKTGALPLGADDPTAGQVVNINVSSNGTRLVVEASGLNIDLAAGSYWIGLTPIADFLAVGQSFSAGGANNNGDPAAMRNPGGSFNFPFGTDWGVAGLSNTSGYVDAAMEISGTIPSPGAIALLGLAGIAARRRRRA